ncbi:MAG: hypothetical protein EZS28_030688 [Streblomastix strix]|uniref:Uncharacterized protein n=1 Tax=Streblomastix strix TaxID=222440 RepID=A0A5J4UT08_9EUKA|nr:MAG: hypothetical protein EZS28_030688 [Streblomastix strix]
MSHLINLLIIQLFHWFQYLPPMAPFPPSKIFKIVPQHLLLDLNPLKYFSLELLLVIPRLGHHSTLVISSILNSTDRQDTGYQRWVGSK